MASVKEFYLKALVTAQDSLSPALKNIAKQADTARKFLDKISGVPFDAVGQRLPAVAKQFRMVGARAASLERNMGAAAKRAAVMSAIFFGAGRGIFSLVSGAAEAGDALQKMSIRTGMSVEAIQEWRYAADRSGISAETLDAAIAKMSVNMGGLKTGTGSLASAMKLMPPVFAKQLKGAESNAEAFEVMIKAIRAVKGESRRALLAQQFFGKSGTALVTLANESADSIEKLKARARELGIISNEQAEKSADFIDKMTDLKAKWADLKNTFAQRLLPSLTPFIARLTEFLTTNKTQVNRLIDSVVKPLSNWLDELEPGDIIAGFQTLISTVRTVISVFGGAGNIIKAYIAISGVSLVAALFKVAVAFQGLTVAIGPVGWAIMGIVAAGWLLYQNWDEIVGLFKQIWRELVDGFFQTWERIKRIFSESIDWIMELMEKINFFSMFEGADGTMLAGAGGPSLPARQATAQAAQMAAASRPAEIKNRIVIEAPEGSRIKEVESKASGGAKAETKVGVRGEGSLA